MTIEVGEVDIDVKGHSDKINSEKMWMFIGQQWHRLYNKYVPMDTGALSQTVQYKVGKESGRGAVSITHVVPYAKHCYYGDRIKWRKTKHPLATARWSEKAQPVEMPKLLTTVQNLINSGYFEV